MKLEEIYRIINNKNVKDMFFNIKKSLFLLFTEHHEMGLSFEENIAFTFIRISENEFLIENYGELIEIWFEEWKRGINGN